MFIFEQEYTTDVMLYNGCIGGPDILSGSVADLVQNHITLSHVTGTVTCSMTLSHVTWHCYMSYDTVTCHLTLLHVLWHCYMSLDTVTCHLTLLHAPWHCHMSLATVTCQMTLSEPVMGSYGMKESTSHCHMSHDTITCHCPGQSCNTARASHKLYDNILANHTSPRHQHNCILYCKNQP